jgi:hypothetical protein
MARADRRFVLASRDCDAPAEADAVLLRCAALFRRRLRRESEECGTRHARIARCDAQKGKGRPARLRRAGRGMPFRAFPTHDATRQWQGRMLPPVVAAHSRQALRTESRA